MTRHLSPKSFASGATLGTNTNSKKNLNSFVSLLFVYLRLMRLRGARSQPTGKVSRLHYTIGTRKSNSARDMPFKNTNRNNRHICCCCIWGWTTAALVRSPRIGANHFQRRGHPPPYVKLRQDTAPHNKTTRQQETFREPPKSKQASALLMSTV